MEPIGLKEGTVTITPYTPLWKTLFKRERQRLITVLHPWVTSIEHVGSTAVPGLAAKPLIDMMAAVESLEVPQKLVLPLQKLGYEFIPEPVFTDRVFFPKGPTEQRTYHLNLVIKGSGQWKSALLFRNYLIAHPDVKEEYQRLKQSLARLYPTNREQYTKSKSEFIEYVLALAKD